MIDYDELVRAKEMFDIVRGELTLTEKKLNQKQGTIARQYLTLAQTQMEVALIKLEKILKRAERSYNYDTCKNEQL